MKAVTDADFETAVLKSDKPVLVQYWAQWSDPSRTFSPVVQEIATEQADKLVTVKMNVDTNPLTTEEFGVTDLPTLLVFQNGEMVKKIVGAKPKSALLRDLATFI
ncbi:thioredoxin [Streptomyces sp. NPDC048277]|uniref:thioredoxin n=1 Tax=Streptomyces sp. NPDC048277 TaxID=3155027 RepID=UPI0033FCE76F